MQLLAPCANYVVMTFINWHRRIRYPVWIQTTLTIKWSFQIIVCLVIFLIFKFTRCFYVFAVSFCTRPTLQDGLFWAVAKTEQVSSRCVMTTTRLCSSAWREQRRCSLFQTLNGKGEGRERRKGRVGRQPALRPHPHWLLPQISPWLGFFRGCAISSSLGAPFWIYRK